MTAHGVTESVVEQAALEWLKAVGWWVAHLPSPPAGDTLTLALSQREREKYSEVVMARPFFPRVA